MVPPTDRQIYESEIATYWFEEGLLISLSKSPKRTINNISANAALIKNITSNRPVPLLIYLSNTPVPDKETQAFAKQQLPLLYSAMAMVSKPGLSQLIMKILFGFTKPPIPIKSFSDDLKARQWLRQYV